MTNRSVASAMIVILALASVVAAQTLKVPPGCTAAAGAKTGHGGYATAIIHGKTGIELLLIEPGTLKNSELADVEITIGRPFYIGKTEVTNASYRKFVAASGYEGKKDTDPVYDLYLLHMKGKSLMSKEDNYPIVWVSWNNAKAFCRWAGLALPSEAQWEYACRAGATTHYFFGDNKDDFDDYAWGGANKPGTYPVAQKKPNPWGLYDMLGNVWEWVEDDYVYEIDAHGNILYEGAPTDGSARIEGKMTKVLRGGAWSDGITPYTSGCSSRYNSAQTNASNDVGFRVVLPVVPSAS